MTAAIPYTLTRSPVTLGPPPPSSSCHTSSVTGISPALSSPLPPPPPGTPSSGQGGRCRSPSPSGARSRLPTGLWLQFLSWTSEAFTLDLSPSSEGAVPCRVLFSILKVRALCWQLGRCARQRAHRGSAALGFLSDSFPSHVDEKHRLADYRSPAGNGQEGAPTGETTGRDGGGGRWELRLCPGG